MSGMPFAGKHALWRQYCICTSLQRGAAPGAVQLSCKSWWLTRGTLPECWSCSKQNMRGAESRACTFWYRRNLRAPANHHARCRTTFELPIGLAGLRKHINDCRFQPLQAARVTCISASRDTIWKPVKIASGRVCVIWSKVIACIECIAVKKNLCVIPEGVIVSVLCSLFSLLHGASSVYTHLGSIFLIQMLECLSNQICKHIGSKFWYKMHSLWFLESASDNFALADWRLYCFKTLSRLFVIYVGQTFPGPGLRCLPLSGMNHWVVLQWCLAVAWVFSFVIAYDAFYSDAIIYL